MDDLCAKICDAKCCVVDMAAVYVDMVTFGNDTPDMLVELQLFNGYIKTLDRYKTDDTIRIEKTKILTIDGMKLTDDDRQITSRECSIEHVDLDKINCITENDVCFILEQIELVCETCKCGC